MVVGRGGLADGSTPRPRAAQRHPARGRPGLASRGWLGDFSWALPSVGLIGTWVEIGLAMVLFLAGVQKIPQELYDAARVDGAGAVREFLAVTLPGLRARDGRRADADDDRRAAQLRPDLPDDRAAGPATRRRCRRTRSTTGPSTRARSGSACAIGITIALFVFARQLSGSTAAWRDAHERRDDLTGRARRDVRDAEPVLADRAVFPLLAVASQALNLLAPRRFAARFSGAWHARPLRAVPHQQPHRRHRRGGRGVGAVDPGRVRLRARWSSAARPRCSTCSCSA